MDTVLAVALACACLVGIALLVVLVVASVRRERRRQERIRHWAAHSGWSVVAYPSLDWAGRLPGRNGRGISLLVSGRAYGRTVAVAEYSYTESTPTGQDGAQTVTTHRFVVTAVRLDAWYPPIEVRPRGTLSRLGRAIAGDGATATGHDAFDRGFRIRAHDPALVRALVGPALIADHLAGHAPAWSLAGHDLLSWRPGRIDDPRWIPGLTAPLLRVAGLLGR